MLTAKFIQDCKVRMRFLQENRQMLCRPFIDFDHNSYQVQNFTSDASLNPRLGMGAVFGNHWLVVQWEYNFKVEQEPSIEFLELYALTAAVTTWAGTDGKLANNRIIIFCDTWLFFSW